MYSHIEWYGMSPKGSNKLTRFAGKIDSLTGNRLSNVDILRGVYKQALSYTNYYSEEHRDLQYDKYSFEGYELLLDTDESHQKGVAEGSIDHELSAFSDLIGKDDTVFDLGANIGAFSIFAAANNSKCDIYSFEPEPKTFEHLNKNVELNSFSDRVNTIQKIVGDEVGSAELYVSYSENQATHSMTQTTHHSGDTVEVEMTTVDTIAESYQNPDVVKIDVEGAEARVLNGMEKSLIEGVKILIDVHDSELRKMGGNPEYIFNKLTNYGEISEITPNGIYPVSDITSLNAPTTLRVLPD
jgi:FkbM family methyltransferase